MFCTASAGVYAKKEKRIIYTKKSLDFSKKNMFPIIKFDEDSLIYIHSINMYISTVTLPRSVVEKRGHSETLFSLYLSGNDNCPKEAEESMGYNEIFEKYHHEGIVSNIIKQAYSGKKYTSIDYFFNEDIPLKVKKGSCIFSVLDGSDFSNKKYKMAQKIKIKYRYAEKNSKVKKISLVGLGGEFVVSSNNYRTPTLNAYSVIPVSKNGKLHPGWLLNLYGNVSATTESDEKYRSKPEGNWQISHYIMVYTKNSCQKAFPNHQGSLFFWNDKTGTFSQKNPSSAFWSTSLLLQKVSLSSYGNSSVVASIPSPSKEKFLKIEEGDCIVDAIVPSGDRFDKAPINTEPQFSIEVLER
ncbi:hypothetical protein ACI01nite_03660 [Acetobacter cibinongensis]|uniref:Uncharacterized protein n=1 Tax=Acetobacter cibinongensis TaxID=146475 RepID=A0A0D6N5P5_9PROT|nr:hypothetical protein [Acetobacter cibinongensis]GAN61342.1 hypothetical protein Abci_018_212 [Acetobacter cibinongensis]GBQ16953.1 hypothetical protein AA0482_1739 [Acetobacter cibinongensis NRIC 0482]GEL57764.1 hypothetical protein ACI01nite_03660 [Acetobacter cibinongensis]